MSHPPFATEFLVQQFSNLSNFEYVAAGSQKAVYSAQNSQLGKIALKILFPGASTERFEREIAAVQQISCDHVPKVIDHGQLPSPYENHFWLTEQWIDGVSLRDKLNSGPISNKLILQIGLDVLKVLVEVEAKNIVHRDIKPENILISPDESQCWLVDFGIARHLDKTSLTAAFMPHTLGYAPIEQLNAHKHEIDSRSDIYSLGVTIYECVERTNPFIADAKSADEVVRRTENLVLPGITRQVDAKGELNELVVAMTRPQRNHRIGTAEEAYQWMNEIIAAGTT